MAQTSIELEPNVTAAGNLVDDFFQSLPTDQRYNRIVYERIDASVFLSGNSDKTTFVLPKRDFPNCYQLNETLICAKVNILKSDKTLPSKTKYIAPINNSLHSLFRSCELQINDQPINFSNVDHYFYKAYMFNLFTYDKNVKTTWLAETNGWHDDNLEEWAKMANTGLLTRNAYFRDTLTSTGNYSEDGAFFMGKLYHELYNTEKLIPPWTKVSLSLTRTSDYLYLQSADSTDTENYCVAIKDLYLLVPTVVLSDPMSTELKLKWDKMPIKYNFRTYKVIQQAIVKNQQWKSASLFNVGDNPIRVYICIVPNEAVVGTYNSSPFCFKRKFKYQTTQQVQYGYSNIRSQCDLDKALLECSRKAAMEASAKTQQQLTQNFQQLKVMMELLLQQQGVEAPGIPNQPGEENQNIERNQRLTRATAGLENNPVPSTSQQNLQQAVQPNFVSTVKQFLNSASVELTNEPLRSQSPAFSDHGSVQTSLRDMLENDELSEDSTESSSFSLSTRSKRRHRRSHGREQNYSGTNVTGGGSASGQNNILVGDGGEGGGGESGGGSGGTVVTKTLELRKIQLNLANQPLGNF